ncbi:MAG TPA: hypothetical protein VM487_21170 [Phycisphaerae bacterium]|nr:hypothetical protein [Phycisphaerae bacterium]
MLEADGRNYLLTLAYFQRIPGCELYGVGQNGDGGGMPQAAEDDSRLAAVAGRAAAAGAAHGAGGVRQQQAL